MNKIKKSVTSQEKQMEKNELERREILRHSNEMANQITKECLLEALLILMKKKSFDKITVSELVERAGVSRTTFYRNYSSIEQIIIEPLVVIIEALRASLKDEKYTSNMRLWYHDMLLYLKDNYAQMLEMLLLATNASFMDMKYLGNFFSPADNSAESYFKYTAFNGAIKELLSAWVRGHCEGDIDLLSDLCLSLQQLCLGK